jgi:hypothetical protein
VQNALICINYARFQVPVPGSGSRFRFLYRCIVVSLYRFLVVAQYSSDLWPLPLKIKRNCIVDKSLKIIYKLIIKKCSTFDP